MSHQQVAATSHPSDISPSIPLFLCLSGSNHDDNPRRHPIKRVERVGSLGCRDKWVGNEGRKEKHERDYRSWIHYQFCQPFCRSIFLLNEKKKKKNLLFANAHDLRLMRVMQKKKRTILLVIYKFVNSYFYLYLNRDLLLMIVVL